MTDHPLTDEIIHAKKLGYTDDYGNRHYKEDDLRTVADWQLEELKKRVKSNLEAWRRSGYIAGWDYSECTAEAVEDFFEEVIKAMRPQQQEES